MTSVRNIFTKYHFQAFARLLLLIAFFVSGQVQARDDLQAWQWVTLNLWKDGPHQVYFYGDNRMVDDVSEQFLWLGRLGYRYEAHENLQLATGYTFLSIHKISNDTWTDRHRFEFEINPKCSLSEDIKLHFRNRLEVWWNDDGGDAVYRSRHRLQLTHKLEDFWAHKYYANCELFYLYEKDLLNEVRSIPVGLGFRLTDRTSLNLFYMIQSVRPTRDADWDHRHVLGTHLVVNF